MILIKNEIIRVYYDIPNLEILLKSKQSNISILTYLSIYKIIWIGVSRAEGYCLRW